MPYTNIHFLGLLSNVDSTIAKLKLDLGFRFEVLPNKEASDLIGRLEGTSQPSLGRKMMIDWKCINDPERKVIVISNNIEIFYEEDFHQSVEFSRFNNYDVNIYLDSVLQQMRLFKEGNICMPVFYYYFADNGAYKPVISSSSHGTIVASALCLPGRYATFTLKDDEVPELQKFIDTIRLRLPFEKEFLQLANEAYQISTNISKMDLAFLLSMIGLEALFNPGGQELRYRISRSVAVLLGKDANEAEVIQNEMKRLYDVRSEIVHTGKGASVTEDDLSKLRRHLRESIKEIYKTDLGKDDLLKVLNSCGFGERPWIKETK